jgi:hypothetical protein
MNDTATLTTPRLAADPVMRATLWAVQLALAAVFLYTGSMKAFHAELPAFLRFVGVAELLGAMGLVVPAATRVLPLLTPLAAIGLTTVMVGATVHHFSRDELVPEVLVATSLGTLAAFVAWARLVAVPVEPREHGDPNAPT